FRFILTLPAYMIPSYFIYLDEMPLNNSGKINQKALPEPDSGMTEIEFAPPQTQLEKKVAEIWAEILGGEASNININENFFQSGGHSLKATQMISKIHKQLEVGIPLPDLFHTPTIRGLARYLETAAAEKYIDVEPAELKEYYLLSSAQKRLYILQQREPKATAYNITQVLALEGTLDIPRLENTFNRLIERHEGFRTTFEIVEGKIVQKIHKQVKLTVQYNVKDESTFIRPFDLTRAPLLRTGLLEDQSRTLLIVDIHHIVSDGVSTSILASEFMAFYEGKTVPPLKIQYKDYSQWQENQKRRETIKQQETYWLEQFRDRLPEIDLPYDNPRPLAATFAGKTEHFCLETDITSALKRFALREEITLFMVLHSFLNIFLSKLSGGEDIVIGTPVAGRRHDDFQGIIGMFVNTLALRNAPGDEKKLTQFIKEVVRNSTTAFENQEYPFENLVEKLSIDIGTSRNPLFDVMFAFQTMDIPEIVIPGLKMKPIAFETAISKFDMTFICEETGSETDSELHFIVEYSDELFLKETVTRIINYFKTMVSGILVDWDQKISEIEIIPGKEKRQLLFDFNSEAHRELEEKTIHRLFEEQAAKKPTKIAVTAAVQDGENEDLTYRQLEEEANRWARQIKARGIQPGTVVALMVERSMEMVTGILGILKAGCAYMPIESDYPAARIKYLLDDSSTPLLLTKKQFKNKTTFEKEILYLDEIEKESAQKESLKETREKESPVPAGQSHDPAYVMYTSGTTGRPKGVLVEHRSVVRLVKNTNYISFRENDRLLQGGAVGFDATTFELWGALLNGLRLYLVEKEAVLDTMTLGPVLKNNKITVLWLTSMLFNRLAEQDPEIFSHLRCLLTGGDVLSPAHIDKVREKCPQVELINGYGPTENTTFSTTFSIKKSYGRSIPIGSAIANSTTFILDRNLRLVPIGVAGELYVGGNGVARGYLNRPELTAEKFINYEPGDMVTDAAPEHPPKNRHASTLYKTGDQVRWLPGGIIEFMGRIDTQVKIRGYRIELGEIENQLLTHEKIKEALVTAMDDKKGDKSICAYIVASEAQTAQGEQTEAGTLNAAELREFLGFLLPEYMIPTYFVPIEAIPLSPNGKVNCKALPEPTGAVTGTSYTAPRNRLEEKLTGMWAEILALESGKISIDASFFDLGGHSLKATLLISEIHKQLNAVVPLAELFKTPAIRKLARYIETAEKNKHRSIDRVESKEYYPVSPPQKRLYIVQQLDENSTAYNIPSVFKLEGTLDRERLENTFREMVKRHESLRTSFRMINGEPGQIVHRDVEFEIETHKIGEGTIDLTTKGSTVFFRPFALTRPPLLRVSMSAMKGNTALLIMDMHHIISDGTSVAVFIKEFMALYAGEKLAPLNIQYKDYTGWLKQTGMEEIKKQENFWLNRLGGEIPLLELPTDFARPEIQNYEGKTLDFEIGTKETEKIKQLALKEETTLFMLLLTMFNILLAKLSGHEDILVGTPIAGRRHADLEPLIGVFINTLVMRNYPGEKKSVSQFLQEVKNSSLQAYDNQEYPFEELVEKLELRRSVNRNPLFDVMFILQNTERVEIEIPGLTLTPFEYEHNVSKFDLTLTCLESEDNLEVNIRYSTALYKDETISRFRGYFENIISSIIDHSAKAGDALREWDALRELEISGMDILPEEEKHTLLYGFNAVPGAYPADKTIHGLFEEQVERTPEKLAVVANPVGKTTPGTVPHTLTYRQLNRRANQLARILKAKGVGPDTITALRSDPVLEMMVGILAVLKAGGAYLPIDPRQPDERMVYLLNDSRTPILLDASDNPVDQLPSFDGLTLALGNEALYTGNSDNLEATAAPLNIVYTIYTSGTTGKSKGTLLENKNLVNYVSWFAQKAALTTDDRTVLLSSFAFDLGYTSIYSAILNGSQLHIVPGETYLSPEDLIRYVGARRITYLKLTPSLFSTIVKSALFTRDNCKSVRLILLGGEEIKLGDVKTAHETITHTAIMNHYGPTEATIGCVAQYIDFDNFEDYLNRPSIGSAIKNMRVSIMDKSLRLVPAGVAGELCISGESVARGYLNRPELTAEKFIPHPYIPGEAMYRTGDLAGWLPGGVVEFLGRQDSQIKIRGYRVELGEIEHRLMTHEHIKEAAVILRKQDSGDNYLCAYYVVAGESKKENAPATTALKDYLAVSLPDYMIPSYFVTMDQIPLTPNGKLNRKRLPEPAITGNAEKLTAPRTPVEEKLTQLFRRLLETKHMGIDSDFFRCGGHSLKAIMLISAIYKELEVKLQLKDIFQASTVRSLAEKITGIKQTGGSAIRYTSITANEKKEYYYLSPAQKRLFILQRLDEKGTGYNMPRGIILEGTLQRDRLEKAFKKMIERHESLRTTFHQVDDEPVQAVQPYEKAELSFEYGTAVSSREKIECEDFIKEFVRPFHLEKAPLLRVALLELNRRQEKHRELPAHLLLLDMHHIVSDGVSMQLFIKEFAALYAGEELEPLKLHYRDYSQWQNSEPHKEALNRQEKYWLTKFSGDIPVSQIYADYPRPPVRNFEGSSFKFRVNRDQTAALKEFAMEEDVTLYMLLLSMFYLLLLKIGGSDDIVVGTPTAGRRHPDLEGIIGMFVNTLALRHDISSRKTFRQLLKEVKVNALEAFENQDYPFEELVEKTGVQRDTSGNPLFDVMFVLQNMQNAVLELPGLTLTPYEDDAIVRTSKFDLTLLAVEGDETLGFVFEYCTKIFKRSTIERFTGYFREIVSRIPEPGNKDESLSEIEIITEEEKNRLLYEFNDTQTSYPHTKTIHEIFAQKAREVPGNEAVVARTQNH
ncbi:MAG: amino acid adenylation domain-containing protein, partial [bacterium]|nr:amino acid adenylation domain-containing protein [bacterium]